MTPSPQQQSIIDWVVGGSGNLIVQAFAGTGKTTTGLMCLQYMTGDVFFGAYSKPIQLEIEQKVGALRHQLNCDVAVKTIHAAGLGAFQRGKARLDIQQYKTVNMIETLGTDDDAYLKYEKFLTKLVSVAKLAGVGVLENDVEQTWEELIDYYSIDDELPEDVGDDDQTYAELISNLITYAQRLYKLSLQHCSRDLMLDYDDMLLAPLYFKCPFKRYDWVILDEVQDCSAMRRAIGVRMLKPNGRMLAIGDRFQNIFGFTGCKHDEMEQLKQQTSATELPLSVTYRCPKSVVRIANTWVPAYSAAESAPEGVHRTIELEPKNCTACDGSGRDRTARAADDEALLCKSCGGTGKTGPGFWDEAHGLTKTDVILCRNNRPIVELAYQLLRKGIPCRIEGRDFAGSLIKLCRRWRCKELNVLEERLLTYRQHEAAKWRKKKNEERAAAIEDKVDTLLSLLDAVRSSGKTKVTDLIDKINLMFGDTKPGDKPPVLTLSTIHKAKGKEWNRVYLLGRGKYQPSKWAKLPWELQAENNLLYVGVTRAKSELVDVVVSEERKRRV